MEERFDDRPGSLLEPEHLEALMVEAVDRVFETPVAGAILGQRCEFAVRAVPTPSSERSSSFSSLSSNSRQPQLQSGPLSFSRTLPPRFEVGG